MKSCPRLRFGLVCGPWLPAVFLGLLALAVAVGPYFRPFSYRERVGPILQAPGLVHWCGTDELGRDELARLLYAGRVSLSVGLAAALAAALAGTLVGLAAGSLGPWADGILMRITDAFLALPALPILLILAAVDLEKPLTALEQSFGRQGAWSPLAHAPWLHALRLIGVVALFSWMGTARLVRAQVLSLRRSDFILAARAAGVGAWRLGWRHLLPHCLGPILVATASAASGNILYEAVLSFLGLGVPPPTPSWGGMLQSARAFGSYRAPWLIYFPGLCITATVLAVNLLADRLQEQAQPRK